MPGNKLLSGSGFYWEGRDRILSASSEAPCHLRHPSRAPSPERLSSGIKGLFTGPPLAGLEVASSSLWSVPLLQPGPFSGLDTWYLFLVSLSPGHLRPTRGIAFLSKLSPKKTQFCVLPAPVSALFQGFLWNPGSGKHPKRRKWAKP